MELQTAIQQQIVGILLYGDQKQVAALLAVAPTNLLDVHFRTAAEAAVSYIERYGQTPGVYAEEVVRSVTPPDKAEIMRRVLQGAQSVRQSVNFEYVIDQAASFERLQRMRVGMASVVDLLKQSASADRIHMAADKLLKAAAPAKRGLGGIGTDLRDSGKLRELLSRSEDDEVVDLGIPAFDTIRAGPRRKTLSVLIAPFSSGKSWWLIHNGYQAIRRGWRVCHITLELSEDQVALRYLQTMHAWTKQDVASVVHTELLKDESGFVVGLAPHEQQRPSLESLSPGDLSRLEINEAVRQVVVKGFPGGTLTVEQLRGYLDTLEGHHGFSPDLLVLDYLDEMHRDPRKARWEALTDLLTEVRGVAQERNIAAASVVHTNREADGAERVTGRGVGGAFAVLNKADVAFSYNQTDAERKLGLARLELMRTRQTVGKGTVAVISQSYPTGQFVVGSAKVNEQNYFGMVQPASGEDRSRSRPKPKAESKSPEREEGFAW